MRVRPLFLGLFLAACAVVVAFAGCGSAFDAQSKVTGVRMFGVRADKPFAKPGETVTLEVLAADGRAERPRPLRVFWVPIVCANPRDDLYFLCFAGAGLDSDAGARLLPPFPVAAGGALPEGVRGIPTNVDLSGFLPQGTSFQFRMPDDVIVPRRGTPPYGLAIVFNIACAGQVRWVERSGGSPQQLPLRCTDEAGTPLSPDDYVIGINRVYSYADRTNGNPVVERVTLDGVDVDVTKGITVARCEAPRREDCPARKINIQVAESSWEPNPAPGAAAGQREQIWVAYYSDLGEFKNDARLLFDARQGRVSESDVEFRAPDKPGGGTVWAVVHDNRAGAAFVSFPVRVE
jgi:hypothetical protein